VPIWDFDDGVGGVSSPVVSADDVLFGSSDLLARFKRYARRPTTDESLTDASIYEFLTEAQQEAASEVALHIPALMVGAPALLTSTDGGVTYTFGTDGDGNAIVPLVCEVYAMLNGRELYASSYANRGGDFVIEGDRIRGPGNQPRVYSSGPYARLFAVPGTLNATHNPTLAPFQTRPLIVWRALEKWTAVGGLRDPRPYAAQYANVFKSVVLGLKRAFVTRNAPAREGLGGGVWWTGLSSRSVG
jgi:hypothetical protein